MVPILRLLVVLVIVGGVVIFALQNASLVVPLVVLGNPTAPLPLAVWLLGAIAAGSVTTLVITGLAQIPGGGRRPRFYADRPRYRARPVDPHTPSGGFEDDDDEDWRVVDVEGDRTSKASASTSSTASKSSTSSSSPRDSSRSGFSSFGGFSGVSSGSSASGQRGSGSSRLEDWESFTRPRTEWEDWQTERLEAQPQDTRRAAASGSTAQPSSGYTWAGPTARQSSRSPDTVIQDTDDEDWQDWSGYETAGDRPRPSSAAYADEPQVAPRYDVNNYDYDDYDDEESSPSGQADSWRAEERPAEEQDRYEVRYESGYESEYETGYGDSYTDSYADGDENPYDSGYGGDRSSSYGTRDYERSEYERDEYTADYAAAYETETAGYETADAPSVDSDADAYGAYGDYGGYGDYGQAAPEPDSSYGEADAFTEAIYTDYVRYSAEDDYYDDYEKFAGVEPVRSQGDRPSASNVTASDGVDDLDTDLDDFDDWDGDDGEADTSSGTSSASAPPDPTPSNPPQPERKIFEVQREPKAVTRSGTIYSFSYREPGRSRAGHSESIYDTASEGETSSSDATPDNSTDNATEGDRRIIILPAAPTSSQTPDPTLNPNEAPDSDSDSTSASEPSSDTSAESGSSD